MVANRQYEAATVFNARCADMRHLWEPSREYLGKPTEKPNYFGLWLIPKTQAHWSSEPVFGGVMAAFGKLLAGQLQHFAQNPNAVQWPIADGDMPSPTGKTSEFAKGHWLFGASTGNQPNIELVQAGAPAPVKLQTRVGVKPGDYCMLGVTAAVKQNQPNGVKFYLNACVFTHPGEEIVFANSVSGAELMRQAQAQGLQVAGFAPAGGGFGAPGGFAPQPGGFGGAPGGFTPPGAGGFAPTTASPAPLTAPNGPAFGGGAAFPSNAQPGYGQANFQQQPAAFPGAPAPGGWPQR
jgi:hypothetical protein